MQTSSVKTIRKIGQYLKRFACAVYSMKSVRNVSVAGYIIFTVTLRARL